MQNTQINEDHNLTGMYWSYLVRRDDVNLHGSGPKIERKCPFDNRISQYLEQLMEDFITIAIDEYKIRNIRKLEKAATSFISIYTQKELAPTMTEINVIPDVDGIRILFNLGDGYGVDFLWGPYNDHIEVVKQKYKTTGQTDMRSHLSNLT